MSKCTPQCLHTVTFPDKLVHAVPSGECKFKDLFALQNAIIAAPGVSSGSEASFYSDSLVPRLEPGNEANFHPCHGQVG